MYATKCRREQLWESESETPVKHWWEHASACVSYCLVVVAVSSSCGRQTRRAFYRQISRRLPTVNCRLKLNLNLSNVDKIRVHKRSWVELSWAELSWERSRNYLNLPYTLTVTPQANCCRYRCSCCCCCCFWRCRWLCVCLCWCRCSNSNCTHFTLHINSRITLYFFAYFFDSSIHRAACRFCCCCCV